jgi:hypothetical protein
VIGSNSLKWTERGMRAVKSLLQKKMMRIQRKSDPKYAKQRLIIDRNL